MPITSVKGQDMLSRLPRYYENSRIVGDILQAQGTEFDQVQQKLDDVLNQIFVNTATWGLDRWEKELGLTVAVDQPITERRDKINSRLRGYGTATINVIKVVAESYDKGLCQVVENHASYTITIRFIDTTGIPPNLEDLKAAVRAVVPAHLDINYEYNYFIWDELDAKNWTWDELDALNLTWDQIEVYK